MASELSKAIEVKLRQSGFQMHDGVEQRLVLPQYQDGMAATTHTWSTVKKAALCVVLALLLFGLVAPSLHSVSFQAISWRGAGAHGTQLAAARASAASTVPLRVAFVSAIIGNYERTAKPVAKQTVPVDCILYTDRPELETHGTWRIIDAERYRLGINATDASPSFNNSLLNNTHTFNRAKFFKLNLHRLPELAGYDVVVWLDATVEVTSPNAAATLVWLLRGRGAVVATLDHPKRTFWVDEVAASHSSKYASTVFMNQSQPFQDVDRQAAAALADGFDPSWQWLVAPHDPRYRHFPIPLTQVYLTCLVAFDMRRTESLAFLDEWYRQHLLYTTQDQIGFPVAMWKVQVLPWTLGQLDHYSLVVKHHHGH